MSHELVVEKNRVEAGARKMKQEDEGDVSRFWDWARKRACQMGSSRRWQQRPFIGRHGLDLEYQE